MIEKYRNNKYINNMIDCINMYNYKKKMNPKIDRIIHNYLNRTIMFISIYGLMEIRSIVLYCINFIIDNCLNIISQETKSQLYEIITSIGLYPLLSKLDLNEKIVNDYLEYLKINIRKYGKYYYTDKQINLYSNIYAHNSDIIFSAPTSYGKTHLCIMTIIDMMKEGIIKNILIIVPTKALINEYRKAINNLNKMKLNLFENPYIHPNYNENNIFIFTQERTLVATDYADISNNIDLVLIDESQLLADVSNARSLLLIKALNYFKKVPKVYLSPFVKDIYDNVISKVINSNNNEYLMELNSNDSVVSNNKYIIDITEPNKIKWYNATFAKDSKELVKIDEYYTNKLSFFDDSSLYSFAIDIIFDVYEKFVNSNEKSIIYIASKSESMKVAMNLYNKLGDKEETPSPRVQALINHLTNNIHEKFLMLNFIKRGVAYHNSYLDPYIKRQLEYIMGSDENYIDKLVCTNTIESGVNLSAKNIFILIKRKIEGAHSDIKYANLLGRAARLSHNTQGNLFYIKMNGNITKYEKEFYKSTDVKIIKQTKIKYEDIEGNKNIAYKSFLEDKNIQNVQKDNFLNENGFVKNEEGYTNGKMTINNRDSNGLDYYLDLETLKKSEEIISKISIEEINEYLNCLGNYSKTKQFVDFLSECYDWESNCPTTIKARMKDSSLIATIITFLVQGRNIKDIVNNRIEKMDKSEYNLYVDTNNNYVKKLDIGIQNTDNKYVLFDKQNVEHLNVLIINSLEQTQNLIEFHVKKYIQDFYYRVRKIHGDIIENKDIGNFLEFSEIDDKKIILIENGIVDNFALSEFSKSEYSKFYNNRKIDLESLLGYIKDKYGNTSPFYYSISDVI